EVEPGRRQQVGAVVVLLGQHPADERKAVRVDAGGEEADHCVSGDDARAVDQLGPLDDPDARGREVELALAVDARQLGRLAADQRAARGAAYLGGALHELGDLVEIELGGGDIVEQEQRLGAGRDHVVDAMGGHVGAAVAEPAPVAGHNRLRPDRVERGGEQPAVVKRIEAGEGAEALRTRRLDRGTKPVDHVHGLRQRDAGRLVRVLVAHVSSLETYTGSVVALVSPLTSWTFDPIQLTSLALIGFLYHRRVRTLDERGTPVESWRLWSFWSGLALLFVVLASPVDALGEKQFLF